MPKIVRFPDFLCIGAQKAGTSWLHRNLRQHSRLWLPVIKELHYFDKSWVFHPSIPDVRKRMWYMRTRSLLRRLKRGRPLDDPEVKWLIRYLFLPRNDRWYGSLFPADPNLIVGEVTPAYAILDANVVARMAALMPRAKIIYILRNPIDRSWSATAMNLEHRRNMHIDLASDDEIWSTWNTNRSVERADYVRHISLWRRHFGEDNMFIGFFDELSADPATFLRRVLDFLGVESSDENVPAGVRDPVGARPYDAIPDRHLRRLADLHLDSIRSIHAGLPNAHTRKWLEMAVQYASPG